MLQPRQRRARQPDDPAVTGSRSRVTSHVISLRRLLASGFSAGVVLGVVALAGCSGSPSGPATAFGAAAKLTFVVQPSDAIVGAADTPAVQVAIQDARGNTVTTATTSITLGIGTNPGTGTLSGTTTVAAINGVATFANMRVNTLGAGYTLTASAATLTGATSHSFNIVTASACPAPAPQPTPASASSWQWTNLGEPFDESDLQSVRVDPEDNDVLYVGGGKGLFVSRDAGQTWTKAVIGNFLNIAVEFAPGHSCTVYAVTYIANADRSTVIRSTDRGQTWATVLRAASALSSLHAGRERPGLILAGSRIAGDRTLLDGFYRSEDGGDTWSFQQVDGGSRGLIFWAIEEDATGFIYSGSEIYNHPQPYHPQLFRSIDRGLTWQDATGVIPWHVDAIQTHPSASKVYALTEGAGLYVSTDAGGSWRLTNAVGPELDLLLDPLTPTRLFGGEVFSLPSYQGGAFASTDSGETFHGIGLTGITVAGLALAQSSTVLYAVGYQSGVWRAIVPDQP